MHLTTRRVIKVVIKTRELNQGCVQASLYHLFWKSISGGKFHEFLADI